MTYRLLLFALLLCNTVLAQDISVAGSEAADGLDLMAVAELFRTTGDAESFERALNDESRGINNLDLDEDGNVDYIRVMSQMEGSTHILILQVPLGEEQYQDVATIEVESENDKVAVQVHGNSQIYGPNYYVQPSGISWGSVAFVAWLYRPSYRPYISPYRYNSYPRYYNHWRPITHTVYRTRVVQVYKVSKVRYEVATTSRVKSAQRVYAAPRSSTLVKKSLRQPTKSQKEYQARRKTKAVKGGGFGSSSTSSRKSTSKSDDSSAKAANKSKSDDSSAKATRTKTTRTKTTRTKTTKTKTSKSGGFGKNKAAVSTSTKSTVKKKQAPVKTKKRKKK